VSDGVLWPATPLPDPGPRRPFRYREIWVDDEGIAFREPDVQGIPTTPYVLAEHSELLWCMAENHQLQQELQALRAEPRTTKSMVLRCQDERAQGNGMCGACAWCVLEVRDRLSRVMRELTRLQPGGSPPGGDEPVLAHWIVRATLDRLRELEGVICTTPAVRAQLATTEALLKYVRTFLPTDEDGCFTLPDGSCISSGPCLHTRERDVRA
jgi:hypothetical protein